MASTVALVGNPNCGKTSLFNRLTGARQKVGNWPGVTVDRKVGAYRHGGRDVRVVDLPGIYALDDAADDAAVDAQIALDYLLGGEPGLIVNVVDAANLERNLYLTAQLLELGLPVVVALTLGDVAAKRGLRADVDALAEALDCPVVALDPRRGRGTHRVRDAVEHRLRDPVAPACAAAYPAALERALARDARRDHDAPRWATLAALADAPPPELADALDDDVDIVIADGRYGFARAAVAAAQRDTGRVGASATERVDRVVLNRWLGIPIFLTAMYLLFMLTINVGGAFVDVFDGIAGAVFVHGAGDVLTAAGAPEWLRVLVADGIGGGIRTVASFIPIVGVLFLLLAALEDSGYMARAAFVMDRVMRVMGLPGTSFVPLLLGFGCNVPAIMATRTLDRRRDRIMTIMMNPFMSCGARLPVYALFAAVFFPAAGQQVVFLLYLIGMAAAVLTGLLLKHTLLRGPATPLVMELGPYHLPAPRGVLRHGMTRLRGFVFGAGKIIVLMVFALSVLGSIGTDGAWHDGGGSQSLLATASRAATPAFAPLGIDGDNWPATVGVVTGLFAKETVVGTINALYDPRSATAAPTSVGGDLRAALTTVPTNLKALGGRLSDPLGMSLSSSAAAGARTGAGGAVRAELGRRFDGAAGAFAYLLFVLLYAPCAAATGAIRRETTRGWTIFAIGWTTALAYGAATLFYQGASFGRHPASSAAWIIGVLGALALAAVGLRVAGTISARRPPRARPARPLIPEPAREHCA